MHILTHAAQCAEPMLHARPCAGHINHDIFWTNLAPEKVRHRFAWTVLGGKSMCACAHTGILGGMFS
jgi:superoxide dismutase